MYKFPDAGCDVFKMFSFAISRYTQGFVSLCCGIVGRLEWLLNF